MGKSICNALLRSAQALVLTGLLAATASAANLHGHLYQPTGPPFWDNPYAANRSGAGAGGANNQVSGVTAGSDSIGFFGRGGLNAGTYSLGFFARDQFHRKFLFGINLPEGQIDVLTAHTPEYSSSAMKHFESWQVEYAQSFQAWGPFVTQVSARFPANTEVLVTIHDGQGPNAPQIGPARYIQGDHTNDTHAMWSAGEVPTVPGNFYTVKFRHPSNQLFSMLYADGRNMGGEDFPGGKTWVNGQLYPHPLRIVVGMDNDGVLTTFNTNHNPKTNRTVGQYVGPGVSAGQIIIAKGTSVVGFTARLGSPGPFNVAVFQGPGPNGEGENQIGPARRLEAIPWNFHSGVTWEPGLVPVTPGQPYYIRIREINNQEFVIYRTIENEYLPGSFRVGSTVFSNFDLSGMVAEEEFTGSTLTPQILFDDWEVVSRTSTTATIRWRTVVQSYLGVLSPAQTTAKIRIGEGSADYTDVREVNTPASNHTYTITGLKPGTKYHVRVEAEAPFHRPRRSRDMTFVTDPTRPNLARNPGFEDGVLTPWVVFGNAALKNLPATGSGGLGGVKARTGNYYVGDETNSGQKKGGVRLRILDLDPTKPVHVRASLWTYQVLNNEQFDAAHDYMVLGRIGIDPTNGNNAASPNIVWSHRGSGQQWYDYTANYVAYHPSRYTDFYVTAMPQSDRLTIFLEAGCDRTITWNIYGWDDVYVWQEESSTLVDSLGALGSVADGTLVKLNNLVVTASNTQIGANYVQAPDRSAGIRAESATAFTPGHTVSIEGRLQTKPSGERFLADCAVLSSSASTPAISLGATNASLGAGNPGMSNVGLLMRSWGTVVSHGVNQFMLDDGSGPVKISTAGLGVAPALGTFVKVTGIVQLEGTAPNATPVLRPRAASDITSE